MATFAQINTTFGGEGGSSPTHIQSTGNALGSADSNQSKSPDQAINLLQNLSSERKLKADGQPPKKRGPKPDSKPALTRRQELNRQAQRTHRERKELYIKALEQEVLHLKDIYAATGRERDALARENQKLKELLIEHGIQMPANFLSLTAEPSSSGSFSGSYAPAPSTSASQSPPSGNAANLNALSNREAGHAPPLQDINFDAIGLDFVLTYGQQQHAPYPSPPPNSLERPCMDHMQMLCVKSQGSEGDISGHALMATCPTETHLIERPDVPYPHTMPDMQATDLLKLLDLSNRLPLSGEITPIMAWVIILKHEHRDFLTANDLNTIKQELLDKVRCYGFGAVLEEFEIQDAIQMAISAKNEPDLTS